MKIYTEVLPNYTFKGIKPKKAKKENFYKDINLFLKNNINKEEYIKRFNNNINLITNDSAFWKNLNLDEKIYISGVRTSIDLADSIKDVSKNELTERMKKLIESRK